MIFKVSFYPNHSMMIRFYEPKPNTVRPQGSIQDVMLPRGQWDSGGQLQTCTFTKGRAE